MRGVGRGWRQAALGSILGLLLGAVYLETDHFDHLQHRNVMVRCQTCHLGAAETGKPIWPEAARCDACHDGTVEKKVTWQPREGPPPSNLRFRHENHREAFLKDHKDSALVCTQCHSTPSAGWMQIRRAVQPNCFACHQIPTAHFAAPDTACATCHNPFWKAPAVPESVIAKWRPPPSHDSADFIQRHGSLTKPAAMKGDTLGIAASCATCHARDFCITCHVNAPEEPRIQALQLDPRSLAIKARDSLKAPASHLAVGWLQTHGTRASKQEVLTRCSVCHTRETCQNCHLVPPTKVTLVPVSGPGRAPGVKVQRHRPPSHGQNFRDGHKSLASGSPQTCAGCHTREQCLDCHRPNAAATAGYHPVDFLSRHPSAAYSQEASCSDCHNSGQFCQTCHLSAGLAATAPQGRRPQYHDAEPFFSTGHGQAARQGLESCVTCHAENDCLTCHSATGGRRFNPHGPGFNPDRLRQKNPQMCTACHGLNIPSN